MVRHTLAVLAALSLAGCNAGAGYGLDNVAKAPHLGQVAATVTGVYVAADIASMVVSGRTVDDHIASAITGEDCSISRSMQGLGPYCAVVLPPPPPPPTVTRVTYCYRSLASSSCYDGPSPRDYTGLIGVRVEQVPVIPQ